jgi:hypothetical protein
MGKGFLRERQKVRSAQFNAIVKDYNRLLVENEKLKTDPEGVVGQFLEKLNIVSTQNNKLSALVASLLKKAGGKVHVAKKDIDSFSNHRVIIKVAGDADKEENVVNYEFTYEAEEVNAGNVPVSAEAPITVDSLPETTAPEQVLTATEEKE